MPARKQYTATDDAMILSGLLSTVEVAARIGVNRSSIFKRRRAIVSGRAAPPTATEIAAASEIAALLREEVRQLEIANNLDRDRIREREQWIAEKLQKIAEAS